MYCSNCGEKHSENANAKFCHSCGSEFKNGTEDSLVEKGDISNVSEEGKQSDTVMVEEDNIATALQPSLSIMDEYEDELLIRYIGGKKADYYTAKWKTGKNSWNWAAFFLTFFWLGYRKMYSVLLFFIAGFILIDLFVQLLGIDSTTIDTSIGLVVSVVLGINGNQLYRNHAKRQVEKIKGKFGDKAGAIINLGSGPSWGGFWLSIAIFIGYIISYLLILLIPPVDEWGAERTSVIEVNEPNEAVDDVLTEEEIEQEILAVIEANIEALHNKDIDAYMATIYQDSMFDEVYWESESMVQELFAYYELEYEIDEIEFLSIDSDEVVVRFAQTTTRVSGDPFNDNISINIHTFRQQSGEWKFYDTEVEDVQYLGATDPEESRDTVMASEYVLIEAPGIFDYSLSERVDLNQDGVDEVVMLTAGPEYDDPYFNMEVYITVEMDGVRTSVNAWAEDAPVLYVYDINQDGVAELIYEDGYDLYVTDIYEIGNQGITYLNTLPGSVKEFGLNQVVTTDGVFSYDYILDYSSNLDNAYSEWVSNIEPNELYEYSCAACHGMDLSGGAGPELEDIGTIYTEEELQDIIKNGRESMPPTTHLLEEEIEAIAKWLSEY